MVAPIAAVAASFCAALLARLGIDASADMVTLSALVTLLPGMTLTIGMREIATEHLQSGIASMANALVQLFRLPFGVAVGASIASNWFGDVCAPLPAPVWLGLQLGAPFLAALAITAEARARDVLLLGASARFFDGRRSCSSSRPC